MKDLYDRVVERVRISHRHHESGDYYTAAMAVDHIQTWDSLELLSAISSELEDMLQELGK